ncbi:MAG: transglutaminase family protein [Clostridiaceae bacterium]|nr:transglutaminase family protein [Clostridiaceae bacterium]
MKTVSFDYHLKIQFSKPVSKHHFMVRCFPSSDERQRILQAEQHILPNEFLEESTDSFGNRCVYGNAEEEHDIFEVRLQGMAETGLSPFTSAGHDYQMGLFRTPSKYTYMGMELMELYQGIPLKGTMSNLEQARLMMDVVYHTLEYQSGVTNINTTAEEALECRRGVCQDYAHILLALCRHVGIPCRYVVGMLIGEGASHAWVEIYDNHRWFGLDPTNFTEVDDNHVKLSQGRDYQDCILNRGMFVGDASQEQTVAVRVEQIAAPNQ